MKKLLVLLLLFSLHGVQAQYSRIIIQFTDKGGTPYSLGSPGQFLSQRAIDRRQRYNIQLDSTDLPIPPAYINAVRAQGAVTVLSQSKWLNQVLIRTTDSATLQRIRALSFVRSSAGVASVAAPVAPSFFRKWDPAGDALAATPGNRTMQTGADLYSYGNSYNQIHLHQGEYLHNKGFSGQGMMVTVLDAGFSNYLTITAFDSIRLRGQVLGVKDFVAFDNSVNEDNDHGKNCLSIMAANWPGRMVGSAPWASYWLIRTEDVGSEFPVEEHNWVVGAEFADSCGTDLISSSLGYTTFDNPALDHSYSQFYNNSTMVTRGASLAVRKGILVTNSAGNDGTTSWKYLGFPADADSVCAIGATDNAGNIASFSSYGYPGKQKPDVVSVGQGTVYADLTTPTTGNGTSYSNPNLAGLITCLWQAFPRFNNMKILGALYASSNRYTTPDNRYGYGLPNMKTAYRLLKTDENQLLYGPNWLWASPATFMDTLGVRFVSQVDGTATLSLVGPNQAVLATRTFSAESQEIYASLFSGLGTLPDGTYTVRYADSLQTRAIQVQKVSALPALGLSAVARWTGREVSLDWSTLSEANSRSFSLLRSVNGQDFTPIASIPAAGNSQSRSLYSYRDTGAGSLAAKIIYYQIQLLDKDNRTTSTLTLRLLNSSLGTRMVVYPNPASGPVQLTLTSDVSQQATIRLFGHSGQLVKEQVAMLAAGSNTLSFSVSGLPAGEYLISLETNAGKLQEKLLVR